jgi:ABC-2 type transport system permease protein
VKFNRWLPYWAVFQADVHQTLRNWVYRFWVLASVIATAGYLLLQLGPVHGYNIVQLASDYMAVVLRWTMIGSATLIVVLTTGTISAERGTMADSVLSRGISRYQYFFGKWHARLTLILGTYLLIALLGLACGLTFLHEDLSLSGSLFALLTVTVLLGTIISCGVAISAMTNNTLTGVAVLWAVLFGTQFILSLLPDRYHAVDELIHKLTFAMRGHYDPIALGRLMGWSVALSVASALVGMVYFARRDV